MQHQIPHRAKAPVTAAEHSRDAQCVNRVVPDFPIVVSWRELSDTSERRVECHVDPAAYGWVERSRRQPGTGSRLVHEPVPNHIPHERPILVVASTPCA
jgi:hypothetical protein